MITTTTPHDVDTLGQLLAEIATLTAKAEKIKNDIKNEASAGGAKVVEGELFKATYSESNRSTVNWQALAKEMAIPADLIAKHTGTTAVFSVKVTSR